MTKELHKNALKAAMEIMKGELFLLAAQGTKMPFVIRQRTEHLDLTCGLRKKGISFEREPL